MLRKLLKYDFGAVIKLWAIGALAVLVLAFGGGLCQRVLDSDRPIHDIILMTAGFGSLVSGLGMVAFSILTTILLAIRFYRNLFTDEGYLTFTLPVKLHKVINSKIIMTMVMLGMTGLVLLLASFVSSAMSSEYFFDNIEKFFDVLKQGVDYFKQENCIGWVILYIAEALAIIFLSSLFSVLFLYCCITFGSIVAKRAKVVAAIGIYFGANWLFSLVTSIFMVFGVTTFALWIDGANLGQEQVFQIIALLLFGVAALVAMLCSLLYTLQYRLLDRKLNLP